MAKIIKLTQEYLDEARRDFEESLKGLKIADGKINFSKSFGNIDRKATVYFTAIAWLKMQTLIREFDKEVAWHGVAFRGDDPTKDEYKITDILVYPQEVTGVTVTTDQQKYQTWLMEHDDDVFNNIRMQGHSHVNMGTSPSGTDNSLYERILDQMEDSMFYIFLIYNKRGEKTYKIYDLEKNILFETADVTVKILWDGVDMDAFLADAKAKVQNRTYTQPATGFQYPQYNKPAAAPVNTSVSSVVTQKPAAVVSKPAAAAPAKPQESKKNSVKPSASLLGNRKGKRKNKKEKAGNYKYPYDDDIYGYGGFDDDPYSAFGYRDGCW